MDNRPGTRRRRGNAFYADSARAALGVGGEVHSLADVPLPLVHTALGIAVCAVVVALRPQVLGLRESVTVCGSLALLTALTLTLYDRLVYGRDLRHALAATFLPLAAIGAFVAVLAGTGDLMLRLPAGLVAALVVGGIPHLGGLRAAGREGMVTRLLRDGTGVVVLAPLLLAAYNSTLSTATSAALAGGSVLLVSADALLTEELHARVAVAGAGLIAAIMAGLVFVLPSGGRDTVRVGLLLVVWYGLRGLVGASFSRSRTRGLVIEYAMFVAVAAGVIVARSVRG
ncbi:MAG: hypothetical protein M3019_11155 [Candidatus Dormibacteraeota bacterium]|nr:hypothetical protein [Candidatus Dormibacteraeota bacterium]